MEIAEGSYDLGQSYEGAFNKGFTVHKAISPISDGIHTNTSLKPQWKGRQGEELSVKAVTKERKTVIEDGSSKTKIVPKAKEKNWKWQGTSGVGNWG